MSPIAILGSPRRISDRLVSSIFWRFCLARSAVSASSNRWLPPDRSRPRLIRGKLPRPRRLAVLSGMRLGMASATPASSASQIRITFQRGKSSIVLTTASVVGGRVQRADFGQRALERTNADIGPELQLDLIAVDLDHLADQAA